MNILLHFSRAHLLFDSLIDFWLVEKRMNKFVFFIPTVEEKNDMMGRTNNEERSYEQTGFSEEDIESLGQIFAKSVKFTKG